MEVENHTVCRGTLRTHKALCLTMFNFHVSESEDIFMLPPALWQTKKHQTNRLNILNRSEHQGTSFKRCCRVRTCGKQCLRSISFSDIVTNSLAPGYTRPTLDTWAVPVTTVHVYTKDTKASKHCYHVWGNTNYTAQYDAILESPLPLQLCIYYAGPQWVGGCGTYPGRLVLHNSSAKS